MRSLKHLLALDEAQGREIERLRLTVRVLTEILVDTMGLDASLLHQRMTEAAGEAKAGLDLAQLEERALETEQIEAARAPEQKPTGRTRCSICSAPTDVESVHFAQFGLVCDPRHAVGPPMEAD